ncbi:MAG: DUF3667 domain-containing protein [Steroidobacterales bacterium]|jgi:hypothetical protein
MNEATPAAPNAADSATVTTAVVPAQETASTMPVVASSSAMTAPRCENCGATVPGRYCGACGQRLEPPVHSLWHFTQVATEDLTHADSRLWHTLAALLFRPGRLTREFLDGRRARYLPPVRLYLVLSVVFFLVASAVQTKPFAVVEFDDKAAGVKPAVVENLDEVPALKPKAGETPERRADRVCADANYDGPWAGTLQPLFRQACRKSVIDNGRDLQQAFMHNMPRAMFIFLPLLAGLMMLMYWRPRHYYVEHLLLFVHNHAVAFLVLGVVLLVGKFAPDIPGLGLAIFLYFTWYMYRSMRVVYGQRRALTVSKLMLLAFFYLVLASLMLAATSIYSVLML